MRFFNDGQEIVMQDFNDISNALLRQLYGDVIYEILSRKENSFFKDSFKVSYSSLNSVIVKKGLGFQTIAGLSPQIQNKPMVLAADLVVNLQAAHATLHRIDLIVVNSSVVDELTGTRKYKDAATNTISNANFTLQKAFASQVSVEVGTPNAVPVAPAVPAGKVAIAQVYVTAATGIANAAAITDLRSLMPVGPNIEIDTTAFINLTQSATAKLSAVLSEIDSKLPRNINTFTVPNNQVAFLDVTGCSFDTAQYKSIKLRAEILRHTDAAQVREFGDIFLIYNSVTAAWDVILDTKAGDAGVLFKMTQVGATSTWKLQLTSSNYVGTGYVGTLKWKILDLI